MLLFLEMSHFGSNMQMHANAEPAVNTDMLLYISISRSSRTGLNTVFNKKQLLFSLKNNHPEQSPLTITYRAKMTCLCVHSLNLLGSAMIRTVLYQWLNIA